MHFTNKTIAAVILLSHGDGSEEGIVRTYRELREYFGLEPRELEKRRIAGVQSAMLNVPFQSMCRVIRARFVPTD